MLYNKITTYTWVNCNGFFRLFSVKLNIVVLLFTCFTLFTLKQGRAILFCQHFETWRTAVTCLIAWTATTKLLVLNHKAKLVKLSYLLKVACIVSQAIFSIIYSHKYTFALCLVWYILITFSCTLQFSFHLFCSWNSCL